MNIVKLSEQLLFQVRMQEPATAPVEQLEALPFDTLRLALDTDERKKAFWINVYNAFFQLLRSEKKVSKPEIFRKKLIVIAGTAIVSTISSTVSSGATASNGPRDTFPIHLLLLS